MNVLSSAASQSKFTLFPPSQNPNPQSKFQFTFPLKPHQSLVPPCSSKQQQSSSSSSPTLMDQVPPMPLESEESECSEEVLMVRRPIMEFSTEERENREASDAEGEYGSKTLDAALSKFAKKMPIFKPETVDSGNLQENAPLKVNLDLSLYKARVLARNFKYEEAQQILEKCIYYWPEDGRAYVALGKVFSKQSRIDDAKAVYEKGCQATQGENPYIWQCWAVLESKMGNVRRARELFDAATVADKKHIAGWHGWAVLELKQGNIQKARQLLAKGLKYCNGNEYVYQTLALLEVKANRYEQARFLFKQATKCNPKSCASWLAWAQMEMQQENNPSARLLFEKAVQASPKNRFAWHVWGVFELNQGNIEKARKLLKIGHAVNPRDPVLLQSLGLLEYKHCSANIARTLFRKASELDPKHQPVWIAWGWMEWKEGNLSTARKLYQRALAIDTTSESAARCLQAWGVLEQRAGNLSSARRLFRSSLNINSQSYVTWMTWASFEEEQGNTTRAEEIRDLFFQQRTEVVDDASWVMGFFDIIDPALDTIKRLLNLDKKPNDFSRNTIGSGEGTDEETLTNGGEESGSGFDLDAFIKEKLSLNPNQLDDLLNSPRTSVPPVNSSPRKIWRLANQTSIKVG